MEWNDINFICVHFYFKQMYPTSTIIDEKIPLCPVHITITRAYPIALLWCMQNLNHGILYSLFFPVWKWEIFSEWHQRASITLNNVLYAISGGIFSWELKWVLSLCAQATNILKRSLTHFVLRCYSFFYHTLCVRFFSDSELTKFCQIATINLSLWPWKKYNSIKKKWWKNDDDRKFCFSSLPKVICKCALLLYHAPQNYKTHDTAS